MLEPHTEFGKLSTQGGDTCSKVKDLKETLTYIVTIYTLCTFV